MWASASLATAAEPTTGWFRRGAKPDRPPTPNVLKLAGQQATPIAEAAGASNQLRWRAVRGKSRAVARIAASDLDQTVVRQVVAEEVPGHPAFGRPVSQANVSDPLDELAAEDDLLNAPEDEGVLADPADPLDVPEDLRPQARQQPRHAEPQPAPQIESIPEIPTQRPRPFSGELNPPAQQPASPSDPAEQSRVECEDSIADLRANRLSHWDKDRLNIHLDGEPGHDFPHECDYDPGDFEWRCWAATDFEYKAPGLCHKPLYFEDDQLERYGHEMGPLLQPVASGAHFFGSLAILPYKMGLRTPNECVYTLGHFRPGNCAPYMFNPLPFTLRAGAFQAGAVVGAAALIP